MLCHMPAASIFIKSRTGLGGLVWNFCCVCNMGGGCNQVVEKAVTKIVQVPVEKVVEKVVYVDRPVEKVICSSRCLHLAFLCSPMSSASSSCS